MSIGSVLTPAVMMATLLLHTNVQALSAQECQTAATPTAPVDWFSITDLIATSAALGGTMLQVLAGVIIALVLALMELRRDKILIRSRTKRIIGALMFLLLVSGLLWVGLSVFIGLAGAESDTLRTGVEIVVLLQSGCAFGALTLLVVAAIELFGYLKSYSR